MGVKPFNQDGAIDHAYIPRFAPPRRPRHAGGFGIQLNVRSYMRPHHAPHVPGYGKAFKKRVRELHPAHTCLVAFGKVMAHPHNRLTPHPSRKDAYGLPIPHVNFHWRPNDLEIYRQMLETCREVYEAAGVAFMNEPRRGPGGFASHDVGCVRMGDDPKTSVLNRFNQSREVKNLFVVDGSSFTTFPEKNPTLTIVALAIRAAENIINLKRRRDI